MKSRAKFLIPFCLIFAWQCQQNPDQSSTKETSEMASDSNPDSPVTRAKAKVLGTAQDGGLPQIGCDKEHCQMAWQDPSKKRLVSCLSIIDLDEQKIFLLDATPDIRDQVQMVQADPDLNPRSGPNPVDGVFLTHAHIGHYTGLLQFGFESISTRELPVYCTPRMASFLKQNKPWSYLVDIKNIELNEIIYEQPVAVSSNVTVEALKVPHRDEFSDTVGYLVTGPNKRLLFIPDIDHWRDWDKSLVNVLKRVDYAFLDGTFFSPEELAPHRDISKIKHPLITDTIKLLRDFVRTNPVQVYFTHLNHTNLLHDTDGQKRAWVESEGFFVADDGLELEL